MRTARTIPRYANRFVRFGYRRPPPWPFKLPDTPPLSPQSNLITQVDHSTWSEICNPHLPLIPVSSSQDPSSIPVLAHGIETVLRGDGVYPLEAPWVLKNTANKRRPRSHLNYRDSLRRIVQPHRIAWENIPEYVPAAHDRRLHELAAATNGVRYCSSTSSITPTVAALYHLLSNFRDTELTGGLSSHIDSLPAHFAKMHRRPVAFVVKKAAPDVFSVNAHVGPESGPTILRDLGHAMERMLTNEPEVFASKYVLGASSAGGVEEEESQFYHYSRVSKLLLRAQIDCRNAETGEVFDVKTRAVAPIRYDLDNYESSRSHRLRFLRGKMDSYEREFYDMVRTVFLKYAFQLRIGRMAGALVAYHNTTEVLGLEYIPLAEIHSYVFGGDRWADMSFGAAIHLLEEVLSKATNALLRDEPGESLKVVLCTEWSRLKMHVFVQRLREGEEDAFSSKRFLDTENRATKMDAVVGGEGSGNYSGVGDRWHFDSDVHRKWHGIAAVGAHEGIREMGGQRLNTSVPRAQVVKKNVTDSFNFNNYDTAALTRDNFRVFKLSVSPLVNDELAPRDMIRLENRDTFRLRYKMEEVSEIKKEHLSRFVTSLGRVYIT